MTFERETGILQQVRDLLSRARTPVQDVKLTGRRKGAHQDSTSRLGKYTETDEVRLARGVLGAEREEVLRGGAAQFLVRLRERYGEDDE